MWKITILLSLLVTGFARAAWDPSVLCRDSSIVLDRLSDPRFNTLKKQVMLESEGRGCSSEKCSLLMDFVFLTRPKICVEIGVLNGASALPVAATLKHLKYGRLFAIDAWSNAVATRYLADDDPNKPWLAQIDMKALFKSFTKLVTKWRLADFCTAIPKSSETAIEAVPNGIDFLHLDGDYSESAALRDVALYLPKVKIGGYILLSNFYVMVNREQPKIQSFCALCQACDVICSIEGDNAILFRKTGEE